MPFRTSNPALNERAFSDVSSTDTTNIMTVEGAVNRTAFVVAIALLSAYWAWNSPAAIGLLLPAVIGTFVLSLIIIFVKTASPYLVPVYAVGEGVVLGAISAFTERMYPGIVFQAVIFTFATLFCLLAAYRSGAIQVTDKFRMGVVAATGAIALVYFLSLIFSLFGHPFTFLYSSGPLSIGISVVVTAVAALNLVLDFDFIQRAAASRRAPKYMEWYAAFGLLVTLVWLYLEILRLLEKLRSRN